MFNTSKWESVLSPPASGDAINARPPSSSSPEAGAQADGYSHHSDLEAELEATSNMSFAELGAAVWSSPDCRQNPAGATSTSPDDLPKVKSNPGGAESGQRGCLTDSGRSASIEGVCLFAAIG